MVSDGFSQRTVVAVGLTRMAKEHADFVQPGVEPVGVVLRMDTGKQEIPYPVTWAGMLFDDKMAGGNPSQVFIDDERRSLEQIDQKSVGQFISNAGKPFELLSQRSGRPPVQVTHLKHCGCRRQLLTQIPFRKLYPCYRSDHFDG